jgi:hypothetical protein
MAKFSQKLMGKEVGQAAVYAMKKPTDPNTLKSGDMKPGTTAPRVSAGNPARDDVKTTGIKMRGTGAATKGLMSRGPMA